jgi:hypothetical protein
VCVGYGTVSITYGVLDSIGWMVVCVMAAKCGMFLCVFVRLWNPLNFEFLWSN